MQQKGLSSMKCKRIAIYTAAWLVAAAGLPAGAAETAKPREKKQYTEAEIAAIQGHGGAYVDTDPRKFIRDPKVLQKLTEWQDLKFGFMVHWGAYSQWGARESWTLSEEKDWGRSQMTQWKACGQNMDLYRKMYWDLNKTFNPTNFNAAQWASLAKNAGMKYLVFTTMHHDGFCMFDSHFTDYKITGPDCPYRTNASADVTKELFNAFRKEGFMIGAYYSKPSWHHEDFWIKGKPAPTRNANYSVTNEPARWERFVKYTQNQMDQLLSDYGRVDILWLDGGWVNPDNESQSIRMEEIAANGRKKQPGLIVVDRTIHGEFENYATPEQKIPEKALDYPWETNMTMGKSWSYNADEQFKTTHAVLNKLVDVVSKGGNFLLNLGASPEGWFHPTAVRQMEEIGAWMKVNGDAIYATRSIAPYRSGKIAFTQNKNGRINAFYMADEKEAMPATVTISGMDLSGIKSVRLLGVGPLTGWELQNGQLVIRIPEAVRAAPPCASIWTFALEK